MSLVAALFVRRDSIYKALPGVDAFDFDRNALSFAGGMPVVAHPPCRSWGRLRAFVTPAPGERDLAIFALTWCGSGVGHWSIRPARRCGQQPACRHLASGMSSVAGPCRFSRAHGGTAPTNRPGFTSSALSLVICRRCPCASVDPPTSSPKGGPARTAHAFARAMPNGAPRSPRQSANTRRLRWQPGWLTWPGFARGLNSGGLRDGRRVGTPLV